MQVFVHAALLAISLLMLHVLPRASWKPLGPQDPVLHILGLLAITIGLPFFLLSSTSPLLQAWYTQGRRGAVPYRFYALSNAGSMLALLSYPVLVEPNFSVTHQAYAWSFAFAAVAILCGALAFSVRSGARLGAADAIAPKPDRETQLLWIALAACGSALLLAITNHISQNIAAVPFLWVIPLSLYLLSFILCFDRHTWYRRGLFLRLLGVALGGMTYALSPSYTGLPWSVLILLYCSGLFLCCMFCHGELARVKPHPAHLTSFYLMCSLGGAIGAAFVALVAPRVFSGYYELHIALGSCAILVLIVLRRDPLGGFYKARLQPVWLVLVGLAVTVVASLFVTAREQSRDTRVMARNFYGELRVFDEVASNVVLVQGSTARPLDEDSRYRKLMNGTIDHGLQFLAPSRGREPTTYYGPSSGVGIALKAAGVRGALRVGVIGLGAGTLAAYGRPGDRYTFYEINPLVVRIANQEFSFLRDSPAAIQVVLGDARLSLEQEPPNGFDVLVVDAFSGDSIPVHLLTREAFGLYFRHLKPDGVLAVHVSNQYLNLRPVVEGGATEFDREAVVLNHGKGDNRSGIYPSSWVLAGERQGFQGQGEIEKAGTIHPIGHNEQLWTDDYSSLFRVLK
jgi:SAM-dependent methyltransferase